MLKRFTLSQLKRLPNLCDNAGQWDQIKILDDCYKVTLSRATVADGAPYNNQVTVYKLGGAHVAYKIIDEYEAI